MAKMAIFDSKFGGFRNFQSGNTEFDHRRAQGCSRWLFYSQVAFFKTSWRVKLVALKPPKKWLFLNLVAIATKKVASFEILWIKQ